MRDWLSHHCLSERYVPLYLSFPSAFDQQHDGSRQDKKITQVWSFSVATLCEEKSAPPWLFQFVMGGKVPARGFFKEQTSDVKTIFGTLKKNINTFDGLNLKSHLHRDNKTNV